MKNDCVDFIRQYGTPSCAYIAAKIMYFWSDEWEQILGGFKAIDHFILIYDDLNNTWYNGEVVKYNENTLIHTIKFDYNENLIKN